MVAQHMAASGIAIALNLSDSRTSLASKQRIALVPPVVGQGKPVIAVNNEGGIVC